MILKRRWKATTPTMILITMKAAVNLYRPDLGFESKGVSNLSLRYKVYMRLLCSGFDSDIIKMIGRWCSNNIICYLHVQLEPIMSKFSSVIIMHGTYSFMPHQEESCF